MVATGMVHVDYFGTTNIAGKSRLRKVFRLNPNRFTASFYPELMAGQAAKGILFKDIHFENGGKQGRNHRLFHFVHLYQGQPCFFEHVQTIPIQLGFD